MNKELTPLEAYGNIIKSPHLTYLFTYFEKEMDIIKSALKENIELKQMIENFNEAIGEPFIISPASENKLKAFEIMKTKQIDIAMILACESAEDYNRWCDSGASWSNEYVTEDEFNTLKEVLL